MSALPHTIRRCGDAILSGPHDPKSGRWGGPLTITYQDEVEFVVQHPRLPSADPEARAEDDEPDEWRARSTRSTSTRSSPPTKSVSEWAQRGADVVKGKQDGQSIQWTFPGDGLVQRGQFDKDGKETGLWHWSWPDGEKQEAPFVGGVKHGRAVVSFPDGDKEEEWYDEGKLMRAKKTFAGGEVQEGRYDASGQEVGLWHFSFPDGQKEEAAFVEGKMHGRRVASFPNGDKEEEWYDGGKLMRAKKTFLGGEVHEGGYDASGQEAGLWHYSFPDGRKKEVPFVEGKIHGRAVNFFPDGSRGEVWYNDGKLTRILIADVGGTVVEKGGFDASEQRTGPWILASTGPDGNRGEGEYVSGKKHGLWTYTAPDGTRTGEYQYVNGTVRKISYPAVSGRFALWEGGGSLSTAGWWEEGRSEEEVRTVWDVSRSSEIQGERVGSWKQVFPLQEGALSGSIVREGVFGARFPCDELGKGERKRHGTWTMRTCSDEGGSFPTDDFSERVDLSYGRLHGRRKVVFSAKLLPPGPGEAPPAAGHELRALAGRPGEMRKFMPRGGWEGGGSFEGHYRDGEKHGNFRLTQARGLALEREFKENVPSNRLRWFGKGFEATVELELADEDKRKDEDQRKTKGTGKTDDKIGPSVSDTILPPTRSPSSQKPAYSRSTNITEALKVCYDQRQPRTSDESSQAQWLKKQDKLVLHSMSFPSRVFTASDWLSLQESSPGLTQIELRDCNFTQIEPML